MVNEHKHAIGVISSIVCSNTSTYRSVFRKTQVWSPEFSNHSL